MGGSTALQIIINQPLFKNHYLPDALEEIFNHILHKAIYVYSLLAPNIHQQCI